MVLIANTIRLSIFSRRREIEVMKLVGATNWFVRVPFVLEGMLTGFAGAAGAVALLSIVYIGLSNLNGGLTDPAKSFPGGVAGLGLLLVGVRHVPGRVRLRSDAAQVPAHLRAGADPDGVTPDSIGSTNPGSTWGVAR